jgi:polyisoprenoid-binding protein YceI
MRRIILAATAAVGFLGLSTASRAADYNIDPNHTHVLFLVDHLGFSKMVGLFANVGGTFSFDPANIGASTLAVSIKTASIQTQFTPRDNDLKGADWFGVTEFPEMKFVVTN